MGAQGEEGRERGTRRDLTCTSQGDGARRPRLSSDLPPQVPATAGEHPNTLATACYREITGEADIADWLASAFPAHFQPPPVSKQ